MKLSAPSDNMSAMDTPASSQSTIDTAARDSDPLLLLPLVEAFFVARAPRKDSPHTVSAYRRDLTHVVELLARQLVMSATKLTVACLTTHTMRHAFAHFAAPRSPASVQRAWSVWHTFCDFLVFEGALSGNPMGAVARPKPQSRLPKPLAGETTPEQLLEAVASGVRRARDPWPERDLAVLSTLLLTGLRSAEMLSLRVDSVAGRSGERRFAVLGKGERYRSVPIEETLYQLLEGYLRSRCARFRLSRLVGEEPLFVDGANRRLTRGQLRYLVEQCYRHAGIRDRVQRGALVHALRHTFATRLAEDGASITEIQRLLGHSSVATSQFYIDATSREQRNAASANRTYGVIRHLAATMEGEAFGNEG